MLDLFFYIKLFFYANLVEMKKSLFHTRILAKILRKSLRFVLLPKSVVC